MAGTTSTDSGHGLNFQRDGATRDKWQIQDYGTTSPTDLSLTDGSYHLVIINQSGNTVKVYTSESLTNTPANGGTLAMPALTFNINAGSTTNPTYFGNLNGNITKTANFFEGTLVMAALYNSSLSATQMVNLIYNIRTDLANDAVNGYAASDHVNRRVYIPLSFYGTWPLDYQPQPLASYAVRRLSTNYTGPILRVNGTDISPDSDGTGQITTNLTAACPASGACKVETWYDQSGNSFNLTQSNSSDQPIIMNSGVPVKLDSAGNPTVPFTGVESLQISSTSASSFAFVTGAATLHAVALQSGTNSNGEALAYLGNPYTNGSGVGTAEMATGEIMSFNTAGKVSAYRNGLAGANQAPSSSGFFSATSVYDSYNHRMYVDGQTPQVVTNNSTNGVGRPGEFYSYNFVVGWDTDTATNLHWKGYMSEIILYNYALTDTSAAQLQSEDVNFFGTNH